MSRLGEILLSAGVITHEKLDKALMLKQRCGGRLGPILVSIGACTQEGVDQAWVQAVVVGPLEQAVDRACGNRFTVQKDRSMRLEQVRRHETIVEDMLRGSALHHACVTLEGSAVLTLLGRNSLPLRFRINLDDGFAMLDDASEVMIRRWVAMILRQSQSADCLDSGEGSAPARRAG